jgi:L-ascorbate metabolism protein UlaG (beta-lactamase superfamily)
MCWLYFGDTIIYYTQFYYFVKYRVKPINNGIIVSMIISYFGRQHFKLSVGDLVIATNPVSKDGQGKVSKYGADITLITTNHPDYNGAEQTEHGDKKPFVVHGPGEYEVKDIFIKGFGTTTKLKEDKKEKEYQNTSYVLTVDGIRITFLGALSQMLLPEHKEIIDETDVLFIPVGSDSFLLNPYDAHKLAVSLEPKLIIPMDYDEKSLPIFLKEAGDKVEPIEKLTIKKKDIQDKSGEITLFHEM